MIELHEEKREEINLVPTAIMKVIGVGGAGGNTVNSIMESGCDIECIAANTDSQALNNSQAHKPVQIGIKSARGMGAGANPDLGKRAAEEDLNKILENIGKTDIAFLTAGMGGGTGSGALPVIARALRENDILSIAVVTLPFDFEGKRRKNIAEQAIKNIKNEVDTLIVIPNQKLLDIADKNLSMLDAFGMINDVLVQSVSGISDLITKSGHINVDFADIKTIMKSMGLAVIGNATASGEDRAQEATLKAITSPLLENVSIKGAQGVLLNVTGGKNLSLHEISQAAQIIYDEASDDAHIILGSTIDESLEDEIHVMVIATGFESDKCDTQEIACSQENPTHGPANFTENHVQAAAALGKQHNGNSTQHTTQSESANTPINTPNSNDEQRADLDIPTFLRIRKEL